MDDLRDHFQAQIEALRGKKKEALVSLSLEVARIRELAKEEVEQENLVTISSSP